MRKPEKSGSQVGASTPPHANPGELARQAPRVAESLTRSTWEDGTKKKPAELLLKIRGNAWYAVLKLIGTGLQVEVEIPEPLLVFEALEAVLALETVPWTDNEYDWGLPKTKQKNKA